MGCVYRIFVEKKKDFATEAKSLKKDLIKNLKINSLKDVRIINRYDVEGISEELLEKCKYTVFSERAVDNIIDEIPKSNVLAVEYLPGQYDQRADSCKQCISLLDSKAIPTVLSARVYVFVGDITNEDFAKIKDYLINPIDSREATLDEYESLEQVFEMPEPVAVIDGFTDLDSKGLDDFLKVQGLAMDKADITMLQDYFKNEEKRNPTITEIKMVDTYWSDHCRHTTFATVIEKSDIEVDYIKDSFDLYIKTREEVKDKKDICLMDLATVAVKYLKKQGQLPDLDESLEINACSVKIKVDIDGENEDYLLMFKNETHNHPTEIEPFGGAATCLGGAIRDPLSGRVYVYQAMRLTGSADPRAKIEDTIKGKLPQKTITQTAARGYSSYGNQIGLATGLVSEVYHEGYMAKRMEVGAVIGAAKQENVIREIPQSGDVVILIGGRTGRDGCGGATGSSKEHDVNSTKTCSAQVQKGNPPEERKIQRLFRNAKVAKLIKRCNDFGAGGVSVAIGELADGLDIDLNVIPKKYEGLDGTELAISESQERMAVVVAKEDVDALIGYAKGENLLATPVATVTDKNRLTMTFMGQTVVDISRDFLNTNGAKRSANAKIVKRPVPNFKSDKELSKENVLSHLSTLNNCLKKGLSEMFDSTIGASTVLMPFGGKNQLSEIQTMVAKIPVEKGETSTCSMMSYGFEVDINSPYHSAMYAVISSVAKLIATGGDLKKMWLSFQEYFPKMKDENKWGLPLESLLGAFESQLGLKVGAIGGKDSMSGTFENIEVPPTLISFAVSVGNVERIVSTDFKESGSNIYLFAPTYDGKGKVDFEKLYEMYEHITRLIENKKVKSSYAITGSGIIGAIANMSIGNDIGCEIYNGNVFDAPIGGIVIETNEEIDVKNNAFITLLGKTNEEKCITIKENEIKIKIEDIKEALLGTLENVFPLKVKGDETSENITSVNAYSYTKRSTVKPKIKVARPKVTIPVFPGTNCEYDTAKAFEKAGAKSEIVVIRNLTKDMIEDSVKRLRDSIDSSNILMIPGGFSAGDEPEGSGKFIATFLRNPYIKDSVMDLLKNRDGLALGICNGFQALIKLGLVPFGEIIDDKESKQYATLTFNNISRHQSMIVNTKITSVNSPWLAGVEVGDIHKVPISHGEGKFVATKELMESLVKNGQIATQYVDEQGNPTMDIRFNPNGSLDAVEGILSPDGRVFGKMGHSERHSVGTYKNIYGDFDQKIFNSGVNYFN